MTLKLWQQAALLIGLLLSGELVFVITLLTVQKQLESQYAREAKSRDDLSIINQELLIVIDAGASLGIYSASKDPHDLELFRKHHDELVRLHKTWLAASIDNKEPAVYEFSKAVSALIADFDRFLGFVLKPNDFDLVRTIIDCNARTVKLAAMGHAILAKANAVSAAQRKADADRQAFLENVVFGLVITNVLLVLVVALVFHKSTAVRLNVLKQNAEHLSENQPLEQELQGSDEFATIDAAFHSMAEALGRTQERERALTENAVDVICSFSDLGAIERINRAAETLWGYKPAELIGRSILELIPQSDRDTTVVLLDKARGEQIKPFDVTMLRRDGSETIVQWALRWSELEGQFFAVLHDIAERKRVERLKQEVVAMVSHDLRAPLTSLDLSLSILEAGRYGPLNEQTRTTLAKSRRGLNRLIAMINTLLDMEKLDAGAISLTYSQEPAAPLIDFAVDTVLALAEAKGILFKVGCNNVMVRADREKIASVLVNLLSNAIKFSPEDSVINVDAQTLNGFVEFRVSDRGRGVPPAKRDLIFERFKQSEPGDASELKGTGLGLAICKAVVAAHKGDIGVRDIAGGGSCFWFALPT